MRKTLHFICLGEYVVYIELRGVELSGVAEYCIYACSGYDTLLPQPGCFQNEVWEVVLFEQF